MLHLKAHLEDFLKLMHARKQDMSISGSIAVFMKGHLALIVRKSIAANGIILKKSGGGSKKHQWTLLELLSSSGICIMGNNITFSICLGCRVF